MLRFTRHGFREMLIGTVAFAIGATALGFTGWWWVAIIFVPVLIFLFAFFRDPERHVTAEQHAMVSPADGKVSDITEIDHDELLGGPAVVIGEATSGKPIAVVKQIVGLIARRIIFTADKGEIIHRGQRIGMIKFGS